MAVATGAPRYYTYKPGAAPAGQGANAIKLGAGQTLGFRTGKGYYAKSATPTNPYAPPARPPAAPPVLGALTPDQINTQAGQLAQSQLDPQENEIRQQQQLAAQQAQAQQDEIAGMSKAAAEYLGQLGPQFEQAFLGAAQEQGQLGQGLSTGVANDVASKSAADQAFIESQGQSSTPTVDPAALHDTLYMGNGVIPGDSLAQQGAVAAEWGLKQPEIALNAGREELAQAMATARQNNDQYAQQLIHLASTYPGLKAQALQQLNQYELDKANYRANVAHTQRADALAARSEHAQEVAAGLTAKYHAGELNYRWANLQFQTQKELDKAKASGKQIDVGASKLLGHIVYKDGSQDPSIKVQKSASSGGISATTKVKARLSAQEGAYKSAVALLGKPVAAPKGSKGAYVVRTSGVPRGAIIPPAYPGGPATTNNIKYAQRAATASNYQDAFARVWAEIGGDALISGYGYTKEQVTAWVNAALRRAGWKRK